MTITKNIYKLHKAVRTVSTKVSGDVKFKCLEKNLKRSPKFSSTHDQLAVWDQYLNNPQQCCFSIQS